MKWIQVQKPKKLPNLFLLKNLAIAFEFNSVCHHKRLLMF